MEVKQTETTESLSNTLTDAGTFSYASLCGVSLLRLFNDEWNSDFKKTANDAILKHLNLPQQVCVSVTAITEGHGQNDPKPYAEVLLKDPCLCGDGSIIVTDLVTISISNGKYDARMRTFIKYVARQLRISVDNMEEIETTLAETLDASQYELSEEEEAEKKKKSRNRKVKRFALIGLATVGGGALIGLTGGLAAPLVAAGAGAIIGGTGAAVLGTTAGVAIIGSLFGVAGAGLAGHKMRKRFGGIEEFTFEPMVSLGGLQTSSTANQLHITIAVTGWLTKSMKDFKIPWKNLAESEEQYTLRYESKHLCILGDAIDFFINGAVSVAAKEALKYTVLSGLMAAVTWPVALISASSIIDNPWGVCLQRSVAVGKELAETLLAREQFVVCTVHCRVSDKDWSFQDGGLSSYKKGNRPVTLIGYSLGARVIFHCLDEMCKRKCCEGIIEDVILLGAPVPGDYKIWHRFAKVVAGKIINGYSRTSAAQLCIAGLQPIKWDDRRMHNIDLTDVVTGHGDYLNEIDTIMKVIGVKTKQNVAKRTSNSDDIATRASTPPDSGLKVKPNKA